MKRTLTFLLTIALFVFNINLYANNTDDSAQVTIGTDNKEDSSTPFVTKYCYSWNETIYSGTEIGGPCVINAISYNCNAKENDTHPYLLEEIDIYMAITEKPAFTSDADWIPSEELILVYSGEDITIGDTPWEKITLDMPFYYNGKGNLVVVVAKKSYDYNGSLKWYYTEDDYTSTLYYANDANEQIAENPPAVSDKGTRVTYRANIMMDVVYGELASPIVITPNPIDLGERPAGAWMRPLSVELSTESTAAYILSAESSNPSFVVSTFQAPAEVTKENPFSISIKHSNSNVVGNLKGELKVTNNFGTDVVEMTATTYAPVSPDVWEKAAEVTTYPYSDTPDFDNLHDNYFLPGEEQDGPDAVYQISLDKAASLSVAVDGTNAKLALYPSSFNGKGGPDTDNYYGASIDPEQPSEPEFPEVEIPEVQGNSFSFNFDDGSMDEWRTIDADGDGYNWSVITSGAGAGVSCLASYSYNGQTSSPLTPDNYVVTKGSYTIDKNSVLEFDVKSLDEQYYDETYEVLISTDGNNFVHIGKETLLGGLWSHKTYSLGEYEGKNVVIGFRHFESTNEMAVLIDNVTLSSGNASYSASPSMTRHDNELMTQECGTRYTKTEVYEVPAGMYYLVVSATERFSVNITAATSGGFNPVTEVFAQEKDNNSVDVTWSWDFINKEVTLSKGSSLSKHSRNENDEATVLGYNLFRRNTLNDENIALANNITDTTYIDNSWGTATMGIYQWGVSVLYDNEGETYETPVAWSNNLGKDMFTSLELTVTTENGTSPAGASVSFINVNEPSFKYETTLDETGKVQWDNFRRGTYKYTVSLEGFKTYSSALTEIWDASTLQCELEEIFALGDLFVSSTGWAMWKIDDIETYTVKLDGKTVAEVGHNYYQFDVNDLEEGKEYTTTVIGEEEMEYTWVYASCEKFVNATDFEIETEGKNVYLSWTNPVQGYNDVASQFKFDFEDETLNGWIAIDANGDKYTWSNSKAYSQTECGYQSWYSAMSYSCVGTTALTPDDYLVTAKKYYITETSKLHFNVSAESAKYSQEHYGVAISTKSNFSTNDFEMIWEETLPAETNSTSYHGEWYNKTIDLSQYAGQTVYIAFRHFNCTDQFWINIDNVELTTGDNTRKEDGQWMYYDNGENYDAVGLQGGASFYWGIMFPADDMAGFAGQSITKVSIFDFTEHEGRFMIYFGGNDAPGTLIHSQNYKCTGIKDYVEFELTSPVDITGEQNVWVVFNNKDSQHVASCCVGPVEANGRWFSTDGQNWVDILSSNGMNVTWQIRAYIEEVPVPNSTDLEVLGAMLFRDDIRLTDTPTTEGEFSETLPYGDYEYSLRVVYGGEESTYYAMSCPLTQKLNHVKECQAPKNLYGEVTSNEEGIFGTALEWPYTLHGSEWLHYDNGIHETGIGIVATSVYWGIMFPAEALEFYNGTYISKVAMYDREYHDGNILIYYGGDNAPETLIHSQPYYCTGSQSFVEFDLTAPIPVDSNTNIWIVLNNNNGNYPAACGPNTGDKNGRWMSVDGESWADIATLPDMAYTWLLRAYVTSETKSAHTAIEQPIELVNNTNTNTSFDMLMTDTNRSEDVFAHYNVYRGTSLNNLEIIAQPTEGKYFDIVEKGTYYYQVTATYFEDDIECESAPANSYQDPDNNYIIVEVTSVNENGINTMMIYPNPTHNYLNVSAKDLKHITVFNALGQMLYDNDTNSDNEVIDMSGFDAGIYMVRIATENGITVQKISVVR